jgi:hypothetical protein
VLLRGVARRAHPTAGSGGDSNDPVPRRLRCSSSQVRSPSRFPPATDDARACRLPPVPADPLVRVAGSLSLRFLSAGVGGLVGPPARATLLRGWWVGRVVDWRTGAPSWPCVDLGRRGQGGRMVEAEERNSQLLTFGSYLFLP